MKLLTCIVTHNRLDYTKRCVESWQATCRSEDRLVVVDNASTDGTRGYLDRVIPVNKLILNDRNLFPGAATNLGWHHMLRRFDATHLHRSDNDIELLPGWRDAVEHAFQAIPELGQLGLLNCHEDYPDGPPFERYEQGGVKLYVGPTGGNSVIPRRLWDEGLRWEARAWQPGGRDEDTRMSLSIREKGLIVGRLQETVASNLSFHRFEDYPDYYRETAALRGLIAETSV